MECGSASSSAPRPDCASVGMRELPFIPSISFAIAQPLSQPKPRDPQHHNCERNRHPILEMHTEKGELPNQPLPDPLSHKKLFYRYFWPLPATRMLSSSSYGSCSSVPLINLKSEGYPPCSPHDLRP